MSQSGGCGNSIRAMIMGGSQSSGNSNEIQYTTIGSSGKFQDFGDLGVGEIGGSRISKILEILEFRR